MKVALLSALFASPVSGMIFFDAASMPANTETAPTGTYANSGRPGGWATGYGVASETDPGDDPDKDGLTNLEEYLTESDPSDFQIRRSPLVVETPVSGTRQFTLTGTLDLVGREITTILQQGADLITWMAVTGTTEDSNDSDPVLGVRPRVLSLTPESNDEVYHRLKVEL